MSWQVEMTASVTSHRLNTSSDNHRPSVDIAAIAPQLAPGHLQYNMPTDGRGRPHLSRRWAVDLYRPIGTTSDATDAVSRRDGALIMKACGTNQYGST